MKRFISLFLSFAILISFSSFVTVGAAEEIIFKDSFENGTKEWTTSSSAVGDKFEIISTDKTDGEKSIRIYDDSVETASGIRNGTSKISIKHKYQLTGDVKAQGGSITVYLRLYDANKKAICNATFKATEDKWVSFSLEQVTFEGVQYYEIIAMSEKAKMGEYFCDNFILKDLGEATEEEVKKAIEANKNAVTSSKKRVVNKDTKKGDIVTSDSFEDGIIEWASKSTTTPVQYEIVDTTSTDGKKALRIWDDSNTIDFGLRSGLIPVKEYTYYNFSVDVKLISGDANVVFRIYDKAKQQIGTKTIKLTKADDWQKVNVDGKAIFEAGYCEMIVMTSTTKVGEMFIDNIKITDEGPIEVDMVSSNMQQELNAKLEAAQPGDVIEIPDGTYADVNIIIKANGTEDKPITVKAQNDGKAVITGKSMFKVYGSYIILSGLKFEGVISEQIVKFYPESHHCTLTNSMVYKCDHETLGSQKQIFIEGHHHKVSNCYFSDKKSMGQMIEIVRANDDPNYNIIENCYFGNFKKGPENGYETIRIGRSDLAKSHSYSVIQGCFFERCNGETEVISLKSGGNKVLYNTFYDTEGSLHFRQGYDQTAIGNVFIGGPAKTSTGAGIHIMASGHLVRDNYIYNLPLESCGVVFEDSTPNAQLHQWWDVKDVEFSNNTIFGVDYGMEVGHYYIPSDPSLGVRTIPPEGTLKNNAFISYKGESPLIKNGDPNNKMVWENNVVMGKEVGYEGGLPNGLEYKNFDYEIKEGFLIPANGLGASLEEIKKSPKSPLDIIPKWVKEQYYDTGIIKFTPLETDPFNTDFNPETLLHTNNKISVIMNGMKKEFDVDPQLINDRTMVPMRAIFEEFEAKVEWDEATATATAETLVTNVKITENSDIAYVNGKEHKLDSPAVIINGRFLVPLRFISESFGAKVAWVDPTQTAIVNYEREVVYGMGDKVYAPLYDIPKALTFYGTKHSGDNGAGAIFELMFDESFATRWAFKQQDNGEYGYGIFDLGEQKTLDQLHIAFYSGQLRKYKFSIYVSDDNKTYTPVIENVETSGTTNEFEVYDLNGAKGQFVKLVGHGNSANDWNNISEIVITEK